MLLPHAKQNAENCYPFKKIIQVTIMRSIIPSQCSHHLEEYSFQCASLVVSLLLVHCES